MTSCINTPYNLRSDLIWKVFNMRLIVSDIPEEGLHHEFKIPIVINERTGPDIANVSIRALRFGNKVLIEGSVKISVSLICSRCLKDFSCPLDIHLKGEFNPAGETAGAGEHELKHGELDLDYYDDDEIDTAAFVKEQVLLALPMKPVCLKECRGICPVCGTDLNEGSCTCETITIDSRLAPLERLRKTMKERKE